MGHVVVYFIYFYTIFFTKILLARGKFFCKCIQTLPLFNFQIKTAGDDSVDLPLGAERDPFNCGLTRLSYKLGRKQGSPAM